MRSESSISACCTQLIKLPMHVMKKAHKTNFFIPKKKRMDESSMSDELIETDRRDQTLFPLVLFSQQSRETKVHPVSEWAVVPMPAAVVARPLIWPNTVNR